METAHCVFVCEAVVPYSDCELCLILRALKGFVTSLVVAKHCWLMVATSTTTSSRLLIHHDK